METKKDYLNRIYHLAVIAGLCTQKREFAELLEVNRSGLSSAMSGDEKNLTDSLIRKVKAFAREHGLEGGAPAPAVHPEPEVQPKRTIEIPAETLELYTSLAKSVDRLSAMVERMMPGASVYGAGVFGGVSPSADRK